MLSYPNILLVGGTGRNVGKTEFICRLISSFSKRLDVYALKLSAIYPDESMFHGNHEGEEQVEDFNLYEELKSNGRKDSSRMLNAGARRVHYLRCNDDQLEQGFSSYIKEVGGRAVIICESNSLGLLVKPGLSIVVNSTEVVAKPRAALRLQSADLVVHSTGNSGFPDLDRIAYSIERGWHL